MADQAQAPAASYRDVFAVTEFRALWVAQMLSVVGDQLARVAVTLTVYDRTHSALLAAVAFAASVAPIFLGGIFLSGLADRFPRRAVMISCDLLRLVLVLGLTLPRTPVAVLVGLLFAVTVAGPPFSSARASVYTEILTGDLYVLGSAMTTTTYQIGQVLGFALGGSAVALLGSRPTLIADAVTYGISALITRVWVQARAAARSRGRHRAPAGVVVPGAGASGARTAIPAGSSIGHSLRLAFGTRALAVPMLFGALAMFYDAPEGVAAPLAHSVRAGHFAVGLILAAGALGAAAGAIGFTRLVAPATRQAWIRPLACLGSALLVVLAFRPPLVVILAVLAASQLCSCFQVPANAAFVIAAPPECRGQVFGVALAVISLGQGAVMILAGAAAQAFPPALVLAVIGGVGALLALVIPAFSSGTKVKPR